MHDGLAVAAAAADVGARPRCMQAARRDATTDEIARCLRAHHCPPPFAPAARLRHRRHDRAIGRDEILLRHALHVGGGDLRDAVGIRVDQIRDRSRRARSGRALIARWSELPSAETEMRFQLLRAFSISQAAIGSGLELSRSRRRSPVSRSATFLPGSAVAPTVNKPGPRVSAADAPTPELSCFSADDAVVEARAAAAREHRRQHRQRVVVGRERRRACARRCRRAAAAPARRRSSDAVRRSAPARSCPPAPAPAATGCGRSTSAPSRGLQPS